MRVFGSGRKRNDQRTVNIMLTGTDMEFLRLIDTLEQIHAETNSPVILEFMTQINYRAGSPVRHECPRDQLDLP